MIGESSSNTHPINGIVDNLWIYNRALNDEEIWELYTIPGP